MRGTINRSNPGAHYFIFSSPYYSNASGLDVVEQFDTYEDYLDSQLTSTDLNYLEDEDMARQLVELGYRGLGDTIRREVRYICKSYMIVRGGHWDDVCYYFRILRRERDCSMSAPTRSTRYRNS